MTPSALRKEHEQNRINRSGMTHSFIPDYSYMFATFLRELQEWSENGKEPSSGDQDLRYYLEQEEQRLKKRGLSMKVHVKPYGDIGQLSRVVSAMGFYPPDRAPYSHSQHYQTVEKSVVYERDHREVYRKKDEYFLQITIMEPASQDRAAIANMDYVCPACGAVSKVRVLEEEGCPYCRGHFIMSDLFPKVSNYWFHKALSIPEKVNPGIKKWILWTSLLLFIPFFFYILFTQRDIGLLEVFIRALTAGVFGGPIFGYLFYCGHKIARLVSIAKQDTKVYMGSKKGKAKISRLLSRFDPAFTFEYFLAKVLSLVRTIVLADDPANLPQYKGKTLNPAFARYLHIDYGGGMDLEYADVRGERLHVGLKIYLLCTVDTDQGIEERLEEFYVQMEHHTSFRADPEFSIQRVSCKSCGASFNALKERHCPYCGAAHDPEEDWIVTEITQRIA